MRLNRSLMTTGGLSDMYTPLLFGTVNSLGTTTSYFMPGAWGNSINTVVLANAQIIMPCDGVLSNLYIECTAPGVGTSRIVKVMKNGVATGIQVTIADAATSGSDVVNTASYVAGDKISLEFSVSGAPASMTRLAGGLLSHNDPNVGFFVGTPNAATSTGATAYQPLSGSNLVAATTGAEVAQYMPAAGTLSGFRLYLTGSPGSGKSYTCTLYKNNIATSVVIAISDLNTSGSDLVNTVSVAEGDYLWWEIVPAGTPTGRKVFTSAKWTPAVNGDVPILYGSNTNMSGLNTSYPAPVGASNSYSTTEANRQAVLPGNFRIKKLNVIQAAANGAAKSRAYSMRINEADRGPTLTISGAVDVSGTNSTSYDASAGNRISVRIVPTSSPAATYMSLGYVLSYLP